jgi:diaminohydroxyphosphoribosylaminopyrimidine deaminase/5-amino-6-(5-phosphoribosylamino)uracil reductase
MNDERFMKRALELAKRGISSVSPNPMVGAVLVRKGKIVAQAFHKKFREPHAEKLVLAYARRGDTLYVNLEPCVFFEGKKTPGCVPEILKSKISRVVIAMKDPNPKVSGRGIRAMRRGGIRVDVGCLRKNAQELNEKFVKWMRTGIPFVGMKVAMSLDGKIATKTGDSKWITSDASRRWVKKLRDTYDALLVGSRTVLLDNPTLAGAQREPRRIILDSQLRVSPRAKVLRDNNVIFVTTNRAPNSKIHFFKKRGIPLKIFSQKIQLHPLLRFLGKQNISSILVEGGSEIFGSFMDKKFVDRLYWFIAPKIIGGRKAKTAVGGEGICI